ncbi:MAG TPA: serine hydrolase, partial [Balneolales bacterium]|nr:serine hydrolase [Balneolales bacterium]
MTWTIPTEIKIDKKPGLSHLKMIPLNKKTNTKQITIPAYYHIDESLSDSLKNLIQDLELDRTFTIGGNGRARVSLVAIDLTNHQPRLGGVNYSDFVYPAGVSKVFIAARVLQQISRDRYSLTTQQVVINPNTMDSVKSVSTDPRRLLRDGDSVTVDYLLDLMLTRGDNSAANCLIDLAGRNNINQMIHDNGWTGSEVTRKYLDRIYEDPDYKQVFSTMTCALHTADFMYKVYTNQLVNPWVSMQMKTFLGRQKD